VSCTVVESGVYQVGCVYYVIYKHVFVNLMYVACIVKGARGGAVVEALR
jgi:hypothetical protein